MGKKRKLSTLAEDGDGHGNSSRTDQFGMGAALSRLRNSDLPTPQESPPSKRVAISKDPDGGVGSAEDEHHGEWQTVDRRGAQQKKKQLKKERSTYPSITHALESKLQSAVRISDLQALVLYLLADGTAPQWVAVKHYNKVQKVVVVMVPGLERSMFNGGMPLEETDKNTNGNEDGTSASPSLEVKNGTQNFANDAPENSVLSVQQDKDSFAKPYHSPDDYYPVKLVAADLPEALRPLADIFPHLWPVKSSGDDRHSRMFSPVNAILMSSLPKSKEEKKARGPLPPREDKHWENKRTRITEFIASPSELQDNGYTLHPIYLTEDGEVVAEMRRREVAGIPSDNWRDTKIGRLEDAVVLEEDIQAGSITAGREVLAMDCEMCLTEGGSLDLTRITLVNWDGKVVMDELVKPEKPVTDYLTRFSGITPEKLNPITTTLSDVQTQLLALLHPRTILIGHSLNADLVALRLTHPFIIDTALLYPHPAGPPLKSSLKWLSQKYLSREIQKGHGSSGHDSIEDATASLDLVKQKCERGPAWGTFEASTESIFKRLARSPRPSAGAPTTTDRPGRTSAVVDWGHSHSTTGAPATVSISCASDAEVVSNTILAATGSPSPSSQQSPPSTSSPITLPATGVDFTFARLRELEAFRGFWNAPDHPTTNAASTLTSAVAQTTTHLRAIHKALPPCTAFIVYSGSGDPRPMAHWQGVHAQFKREYRTRKWDELTVRWTDVEEGELRSAVRRAREGVGFVVVK
ncbi:MAG: hypothetical protein M1833_004337 [Piccolia ochrophora]|nr:MAG: hypothetical protein M1833_004337 [Piccolia ochrophora]